MFKTQIEMLSETDVEVSNFDTSSPSLKILSFENFQNTRSSFQKENLKAITDISEEITEIKSKVIPKIAAFKSPDRKILEQFPDWGSDVSELTSNLDHLYQYQDLYKQLEDEDLLSFQTKFDTYLEDTLIDKVGAFNYFFEKWTTEIKKTIKDLNASLYAIDFEVAPSKTYINLSEKLALSEQGQD